MKRMLTKKLLAARYSVEPATIDRWTADGILPSPVRINHRCYWDEAELEQHERGRMAAQSTTAA